MILRTVLALGALAALCGAAAAQGYPTFGAQAYPPPYRPLPPAAVPDDDDDDIPPHQRAAPGNYPAPPGNYRGPFAREPQYQAPPPVYSDRGPPQQPPYYGPPRNTGPSAAASPSPMAARPPGYPDQATAVCRRSRNISSLIRRGSRPIRNLILPPIRAGSRPSSISRVRRKARRSRSRRSARAT